MNLINFLKFFMILTRKLYDYQEYAVKWLAEIESVWKCGILADDMGLGKTTDIIAHVINNYVKYPSSCNNKTLILCPLSVLHMWKSEFHNSSNLTDQQVVIYYGESRNLTFFDETIIVISTYDTLKSELQQFYKTNTKLKKIIDTNIKFSKKMQKNAKKKHNFSDNSNNFVFDKINTLFKKYIKTFNIDTKPYPLLDIEWNRVILDEAHKIRSLKSQITFAVQLLKSKYRICVTGSPINNSIYDLTSLAIWMRAKPYCGIDWWLKNSSSKIQLDSWCKTFILMRQKKVLITLPMINISVVYIDFLLQDKEIYNFIETYIKSDNVFKTNEDYTNIVLTWILKQRQICCHPLLMLGRGFTSLLLSMEKEQEYEEHDENIKKLVKLGVSKIKKLPMNFQPIMLRVWNYYTENLQKNEKFNKSNNDDNVKKKNLLIKPSSKIEYIVEHIKKTFKNDPSSKFVIFSQWTSYLDLIHYFLLQHFEDFEISRFDGNMNFNERTKSIENFKNNQNNRIFISSLQTGGIGLHLVGANEMIIADPWYNPEIEKQAIDRMNRLGQTRKMQVTKLLISSSIECNVTTIAKKKNFLTNDLFKI